MVLPLVAEAQQPAQRDLLVTPTQTGGAAGVRMLLLAATQQPAQQTRMLLAPQASGGGGGGNQSTTSQVRLLIEEACMAAQSHDTLGILMQLNLALNTLEGTGSQSNTTTAIGAADLGATAPGGGGEISVDRTSAAEEDDAG